MKIDPEDKHASLPRRWGVPLVVATGVAAASIAAVAVFGGQGTAAAKPVLAAGGGSPSSAATSPGPSPTRASSSGGTGSAPSSAPAPGGATVTSVATAPIDAGTVAKILSSCLGSDARRYHAVIGVRTPVASRDWDGTVIAVDSAGQYVQCETKGNRGTSQDVPPTFINNRLWGTGHIVEYFDSIGEPAGQGRYVSVGAGHYASGVAKITISYGDNPKEYPAVMAGGAFLYTAAFSTGASATHHFSAMPNPYVHAYNAAGKEIYNQEKDAELTGNHK